MEEKFEIDSYILRCHRVRQDNGGTAVVLLLSCGVLYIHSRIRVVGKEYRSNKAVGCVQYPHRLDEHLDNLDKARVLLYFYAD